MDMNLINRTLCDLRDRKKHLERLLVVLSDTPGHLHSEDLEQYHLGILQDEQDLAMLEEHLLACPLCVDRAEATASYVDLMRAALIQMDGVV
jgi:hypothetical protein